MRPLNPLLAGLGTTIFEAMSALARQHQAVNLGQGFPDDRGPEDLRQAAARAVMDGPNQYPPMAGVPALREAVAAHVQRFWGLAYDPTSEVLVTSGATEALHDCFAALIIPGDEVIVIEPAYDTYAPVIRLLGGVPRAVRCEAPAWRLPRTALAAAITSRTKAIVVNSPMNPSGQVLADDDLAWLAGFIEAHDLYAICDEVYEHLVYDGLRHVSLATLPGMRARCLRIGSAGKTFSLTGWKVGYVTGPAELVYPVAKAHQLATFTTPPNLQAAVTLGLALPDAYFAGLAASMQRSRDRLLDGLAALGLPCLPSRATYFAVLDIASLQRPGETSLRFCQRLVEDAGVVFIPLSAFYVDTPPEHLVRVCFCKADATIDAALDRLTRWRAHS